MKGQPIEYWHRKAKSLNARAKNFYGTGKTVNKVTGSQVRYLFKQANFKCAFCGDAEKLTVDRIYPLSRGGSNSLKNMQVLCEKCNQNKGDDKTKARRK